MLGLGLVCDGNESLCHEAMILVMLYLGMTLAACWRCLRVQRLHAVSIDHQAPMYASIPEVGFVQLAQT